MTSCGVSALAATRNVDNAGNVTRVNVASIPASCAGEALSLTLVGAGGASLGGGTAAIGNCAATCSATLTRFGGTVSVANVVAYSFAVTGQ